MSMPSIDYGSRVFLAVDNHRVVRAECGERAGWKVETVLAGPAPVTLAADPRDSDRVYAGTQGSGIYQSLDRGRHWAPLGLGGMVVKAIAVSPHDSRVIYAGVKPSAVYKSVDAGRTWFELEGFRRIPNRWWWFSPAEAPFKAYVMALSVSPTEPDVVLAGIELGAVVRSEDGGRTWSGHRRGALRDCHSLKFHSSDGQWVYQAGGSGGGASVSRDGGRTWRKHKIGLEKNYGVVCAADPQQPEVWYVAVAPGPGKAYGENAQGYLLSFIRRLRLAAHRLGSSPDGSDAASAGHFPQRAGPPHRGHNLWQRVAYGRLWRLLEPIAVRSGRWTIAARSIECQSGECTVRTPLITALVIVVVFDALAWGFSVLAVSKYALTHRALPTVGGIRLLSGPMEALGIEAVVVTGLVFVIVSALKLLAAYWLWHGRMDGAILQIILLGLSAIFWYMFALPFGPLGGVAQIVLLVMVWTQLS